MTQLSVYRWHGDKSRCTRADPTKTHGEGITVRGPQTGGRLGPPIEAYTKIDWLRSHEALDPYFAILITSGYELK